MRMKRHTRIQRVPLHRSSDLSLAIAERRGNCVEDDTYEVQQPMSIDDILDEGIQLHHCVGSYYQDIVDAKGDMLIYFMREKAFPYQALITIQVNRDKDGNYFIVEASGDSNREPTRQEKAFMINGLLALMPISANLPV